MKVGLITGSGRGIGKAIALELAKQGVNPVLVSRTEAELLKTAEEIKATTGKESLVYPCDIGNEKAVLSLFQAIETKWKTIDLVVNNAAIFHPSTLEEHSVSDWEKVMEVNVRGVFLTSREAFRYWKKNHRQGVIVNISSLAGVENTEKFPGLSSYVASKFAVVGMTEAFAVEGKNFGIRVNCIAPGAVDTEMLRKAAPHIKTNTSPGDIARTVWHLCDTTASGHLTGTTIKIFSNVTA